MCAAVVLLLLLAACSTLPVFAQEAKKPRRSGEKRILLIARPERRLALERRHAAERANLLHRFPGLHNIEVIALSAEADIEAAIARYRQSGLVEAAEPDHRFTMAATPDDPFYTDGTQWNLNNAGQNGGIADADIDAPQGWDTYNSASNIIVAVIDTGARLTHEDLAANLWTNTAEIPGNGFDDDLNGIIDDVHGINAIARTGDPVDDVGHGTHVTGILGAVGNNGRGIAGVCWGARLMICKFLDTDGGLESDLIQCLDYARTNGARVINCSFVSPDFSLVLSNAFWSLRNAGILVVAAAGNDGTDNDVMPQYPASFKMDNIVAVTATTRTDGFAGYSYGATSVHLAAPGYQVYSTYNGHDADYGYLSGTSMSAPHVSGALALLSARFPFEDHRGLIDRLLASVDPLPGLAGRCSTAGRLNLSRALGPPLQADFIPSRTASLFPATVNFTNSSFGVIATYRWNFGDGSPESSQQHPTHTFTNVGSFDVALTVTGTNGMTSRTNHLIHVVGNYAIATGTFDWVPTNGMTALALSGSEVSGPHPLPFPFRFYGPKYTQLFVSANGLVGFASAGLDSGANSDLPSSAAPNAALCAYWDDMDVADGGAVWLGTAGVAPNRKVVVSWVDLPHAGLIGQPTRFSFQAVLHESQQMSFQYLDVESGRTTLISGKSATIGLEDATGLIAAKFAFNGNPALITNRQALVFVPYGNSASAPSLTKPALSGAGFSCTLFAPPGQTCVIESSSDLTNWFPLKTNAVPASGVSLLSGLSAPGARRFYRARTE